MTHALAPTLAHRHMAAYGLLGWPLAMVAMPVYLQAPSHYSGSLGLPLALTGTVLFLARLVDTVQDPWLGHWIGHWARTGQLPTALWLAAALLAASFTGLWLPPPALPTGWLALWLGTMLVLACTAHSVLHIAHLCWGARLTALPLGPAPTAAPAARVLEQRAAAWREGLGLGGIICASTLGVWLVQQHTQAWALGSYAALFALLLALGLWLLLCHAPRWHSMAQAANTGWQHTWKHRPFRQILLPYFLNALSAALPATLVLFFIEDRLQAAGWAGAFLAAYFLAAAASLPWWNRLAQTRGMVRAWQAGMLMAVLGFAITPWLGPQTAWVFALVCLLTGWSLGADLVLPPVLLARRIPPHALPGSYYGLSQLLGKLALASSALSLPLLAALGYQPGSEAETRTLWLVWLYAGLPCLCKLWALWSLRPLAAQEKRDLAHPHAPKDTPCSNHSTPA